MTSTHNVLDWASDYSKKNDVVKMFWEKLCDTLNMSSDSSGNAILSEVRTYGGNTFANFFRGDGVPYVEVSYDVAGALRPTFTWAKDYKKGDLKSIEKYVLKQMEISDDDVEKIAEGIKMKTTDKITENVLGNGVSTLVLEATTYTVGRTVAKKLGSKAAEAVLKKAAETAATKVGKKVAAAAVKKAARKAAEEAAKQMAKQVLVRLIAALNIVLLAWTVVDIAGPAMRKTIPSVTYIALLRQVKENEKSSIT